MQKRNSSQQNMIKNKFLIMEDENEDASIPEELEEGEEEKEKEKEGVEGVEGDENLEDEDTEGESDSSE